MGRIKLRVGLVAPMAALVLVSGCANRPSVDELADSIMAAAANDPTVEVDGEQASCIAQALLDSGLSDTTLAGMAIDFDAPEVLAAEAGDVEPAVATAAETCLAS